MQQAIIAILFTIFQGFKYAATQFTSHCFCGDSYDKYGKANNCNMKCAASAETCGGAWANQVYVASMYGLGLPQILVLIYF